MNAPKPASQRRHSRSGVQARNIGIAALASLACLMLLASSRRASQHDSHSNGAIAADGALAGPQANVSFTDMPLGDEMPLDWGPPDLFGCQVPAPEPLDEPAMLASLYGSAFDADARGQGSVLLLGNHGTSTSMVTRLLMLMGLFQGNRKGLSVFQGNPLKYWEMNEVFQVHEAIMVNITDRRFPGWIAQDIDFTKMTPDLQRALDCQVYKTVKQNLNRHPPWVMKDPRVLFFAQDWLRQMDKPVCVYIYRHPVDNAMRLERSRKNVPGMNAARWIDIWEKGTLNGLAACRGVPTLLLRQEDFEASHNASAARALRFFAATGVSPVHSIDPQDYQINVLAHIKPPRPEPQVQRARLVLSASQKALWFALEATVDQDGYAAGDGQHTAAAVLRRYHQHHTALHSAQAADTAAPDRQWYCTQFSRCCSAFARLLQCRQNATQVL